MRDRVRFRYDDQTIYPQIWHTKEFKCPFKGYHHTTECGDNRLVTLAIENGNPLHKQFLLKPMVKE